MVFLHGTSFLGLFNLPLCFQRRGTQLGLGFRSLPGFIHPDGIGRLGEEIQTEEFLDEALIDLCRPGFWLLGLLDHPHDHIVMDSQLESDLTVFIVHKSTSFKKRFWRKPRTIDQWWEFAIARDLPARPLECDLFSGEGGYLDDEERPRTKCGDLRLAHQGKKKRDADIRTTVS